LQRNAAVNAVTVAVEELEWGQGLRRFRRVRKRRVRRTPPQHSSPYVPTRSKRFDLILAADVVCHEESFEPLLATLRQLAGTLCRTTPCAKPAHSDDAPISCERGRWRGVAVQQVP
jgi:hypothetical protein